MPKWKAFIKAARLRTLPLAIVGIFVGNACAYIAGIFDLRIALLTLSTALLLQILSNFANDYGDFVKGTDNDNRVGPQRALQSGAISKSEMQFALILFVILTLISGIWLIFLALAAFSTYDFIVFLGLGLLSVFAAITYTIGKKAYGYAGWGDAMVFLFFGLVSVLGAYYLQTRMIDFAVLLPSLSVGLFSAAVLNMNNTRDLENDKAMQKNTIPVRFGRKTALFYQMTAITLGIFSSWVYLEFGISSPYNWTYFLVLPVFFISIRKMYAVKEPKGYDTVLKLTVLGTLIYGLVFCFIAFNQ